MRFGFAQRHTPARQVPSDVGSRPAGPLRTVTTPGSLSRARWATKSPVYPVASRARVVSRARSREGEVVAQYGVRAHYEPIIEVEHPVTRQRRFIVG